MATARVFKSRRRQFVLIPDEFRLRAKHVEVFREGDDLILREKYEGMEQAFEVPANLPIDVDAKEKSRSGPME